MHILLSISFFIMWLYLSAILFSGMSYLWAILHSRWFNMPLIVNFHKISNCFIMALLFYISFFLTWFPVYFILGQSLEVITNGQ